MKINSLFKILSVAALLLSGNTAVAANTYAQRYIKAPPAIVSGYNRAGTSVAVQGNLMVVSVPFESSNVTRVHTPPFTAVQNNLSGATQSGALYVFEKIGVQWQMVAHLKGHNVEGIGVGDSFGTAVAISSNTLVVGAPKEDSSETAVVNYDGGCLSAR